MAGGRLEEMLSKLTRAVTKLLRSGDSDIHLKDSSPVVLKSMPRQASEYFDSLIPPFNELETIMLLGIVCQLFMEAKELPNENVDLINFVRKKAKSDIAKYMAGHISLSQFFRLLNLIDENIQKILNSMDCCYIRSGKLSQANPKYFRSLPCSMRQNEPRNVLSNLPFTLKGRGKITNQGILDFLMETEGNWFRLLDFEAHFKLTKKTAWKYLNLLLKSGVLQHNGGKANSARYCLASRFDVTSRKNKNLS